ncbi:MAG: GWxTD domain-containing protein [candidate division KSB1 bacterium]
MKKNAVVFICLGLLFGEVAAQEVPAAAGRRFSFDVDYARFRNDEGSGYLEVYYGFHPRLLNYQFANGKFRGGLKLRTRLKDKSSNQIVAERTITLHLAEADTAATWYDYPMTAQAGFTLPFGEYALDVVASDSLASARRDSIDLSLQLSAYPATVGVSDVELCKNITPSTRKDDLFYKNALEVVPNPQLLFGSATAPVIFHYLEFYNLNPEEIYSVKTVISATDGKEVKAASKKKKFGIKNAVEVGTTNVTTLPSAKYRLHIALLNQADQPVIDTFRDVFVYNPHIKSGNPMAAVTSDLSSLVRLSLAAMDAEFRQAQYLATKDEIKMYETLTSESGKREFLLNFWTAAAKGKNDWAPIMRGEYLQRVAVANEKYAAMGKEGWQTNRGRVYVIYGKPDEIERNTSTGDTRPHEIWYYYSIENSVQFLFVERLGYGDYEMVHSTKRGELQDENWQRYLR